MNLHEILLQMAMVAESRANQRFDELALTMDVDVRDHNIYLRVRGMDLCIHPDGSFKLL